MRALCLGHMGFVEHALAELGGDRVAWGRQLAEWDRWSATAEPPPRQEMKARRSLEGDQVGARLIVPLVVMRRTRAPS